MLILLGYLTQLLRPLHLQEGRHQDGTATSVDEADAEGSGEGEEVESGEVGVSVCVTSRTLNNFGATQALMEF